MDNLIDASTIFDKTLDSSVKEEELVSKQYKTFSFIRNPFWTDSIAPDDKVQDLFVNRLEEAKELAQFVASILRGEKGNFTMIGPKGVGKTSLLTLIFDRITRYQEKPRTETGFSRKLKSIADKLDLMYFELCAYKLIEDDLSTQVEMRIEEEEERSVLLLIEFCDHEGIRFLEQLNPLKPTFKPGKRHSTLYSNFFNTYERLQDVAPFIGSISTFAWDIIKQEYHRTYETFFSPEKCKTLIIRPLKESHISELLKKRIHFHRTSKARRKYKVENPYPFKEEAISLIAESSEGFPSIALELAKKCLDRALKTNTKIIDEYIVEAQNFSFPRIRSQVDGLDPSQEQVLKTIIGLGNSASATMIERYVNISRPAIIAIMKKLDDLDMIERKPSGREVMFNLKLGVREALETQLQNRYDFNKGL